MDGLFRVVGTCGYSLAWSRLLVLVVQYVDRFSLPESGLIILFFVFLHYNGGCWHTWGVCTGDYYYAVTIEKFAR